MKAAHGFTYLTVLIFVAIIAITSTATVQVVSLHERREKEEELLDIGMQFRNALLSYADATPAGQLQRAPKTLEDLLKDPRYPTSLRHLRKIYYDPLTGKKEWQTVLSPDKQGIIGIYSAATGKPIKIANFDPLFQDFSGKTSYQDWKFVVLPTQPVMVRVPAVK